MTVDHSRTTEFQEPGAPLYLAIDGKHWDPDRIDQTVKLGDVEEWTINNTSSHWHPFHIHINDFQVVSVNGEPVEAWGLNDTYALAPQQHDRDALTLRRIPRQVRLPLPHPLPRGLRHDGER